MPDFVINTGPIIALTAAMGELKFLGQIYSEILIPREVVLELEAGRIDCHELNAMSEAGSVLKQLRTEVDLPVLLRSQLDR